jgi:hypothetical protein
MRSVVGDLVNVAGNIVSHLPNIGHRCRGGRAHIVDVALMGGMLGKDLLGGRLRARMMFAADDVARALDWPTTDTPATLGMTVVVSEDRVSAAQQRDVREWAAEKL